MSAFLRRPFPTIKSNRLKWILILSISLFVGLFLFTFQPFDVFHEIRFGRLYVSLGYTGITFLLNILYFFLFDSFFVDLYQEKWTIGKQLVLVFFHVTAIGIGDYVWAVHTHTSAFYSDTPTWEIIIQNLLFTYAIGLFPVVFVMIYFELKWRTEFSRQSAELKTFNEPLVSTRHVTIKGDNSDESIELDSTTFLFAKSSGNYVEYYTLIDEEVVKVLQRMSLSRLNDLLLKADFDVMKTHRSYLVNLTQISETTGNAQGYSLVIKNCSFEVPVSRHKVPEFNSVMNDKQDAIRHKIL